jgi:hypothetical protein
MKAKKESEKREALKGTNKGQNCPDKNIIETINGHSLILLFM